DFALWHANYGAALWEARDLDGAERELRAAVKLAPALAIAHANLGGVLIEQKKLDDAEWELRESARLRPGWPRPVRQLAFLLYARRRWADAAPLLDALLVATPGDVEVASRLKKCVAELPKPEDAAGGK